MAADAEDVLQEAYLRLAHTTAPIRNPQGFLRQVVSNLATDYLRAGARQTERHAAWHSALEMPDPAPPIESVIFSRAKVAFLMKAIGELPPRCRAVFVLHKFEELSYAEVAQRLGISESTVLKHMVRALAHCKRRLKACAD